MTGPVVVVRGRPDAAELAAVLSVLGGSRARRRDRGATGSIGGTGRRPAAPWPMPTGGHVVSGRYRRAAAHPSDAPP